MQLLTRLLEESLDQGYADAAARRAAAGGAGRDGPGKYAVLAVALLVVGLLLGTAAAVTRARSGTVERARAALVEEVRDRQAANDRRERDLDRLRALVTRQRQRALQATQRGAALSRRLTTLEAATGVAAVRGPGLTLRVEDPPDSEVTDGDPRTDDQVEAGVIDRDLQILVNELWAAGAEAVAVDGQRLTGLAAIRSAGDAILVNFRPLVPPYDITAVGAPDLAAVLVEGPGGNYLTDLKGLGIRWDIQASDDLVVPGAAGVTLRYARTLSERVGSGSAPEGSTGGGTE